MQGNVCHAGSHSGLLCAFIINGKYWLCLNLNYDFWSVIGKPIATFIHWPFLDKTLISRSGTCLEKVRTPAPACNFHEDFMCFGCLLRRALACSKIVTKCYYFWHKSRGFRAFNCCSQEKEDKHSSLQTGDLNRKEGASGKVCSFIFRKFLKVQHKLLHSMHEIARPDLEGEDKFPIVSDLIHPLWWLNRNYWSELLATCILRDAAWQILGQKLKGRIFDWINFPKCTIWVNLVWLRYQPIIAERWRDCSTARERNTACSDWRRAHSCKVCLVWSIKCNF